MVCDSKSGHRTNVLGTDRLGYSSLRQLRRDLKRGADLPPDMIEGMPEPRLDALRDERPPIDPAVPVGKFIWPWPANDLNHRLANHVDVVVGWNDMHAAIDHLQAAIALNPSTIFDLYMLADAPPAPESLRTLRESLPFEPGYLDRVAVYNRDAPQPAHQRVSPRCFVVLPWTASVDPADYAGVAEVVWQFMLEPGDEPPLRAWEAAGGAGIWLQYSADCTPQQQADAQQQAQIWEQTTGRLVWNSTSVLEVSTDDQHRHDYDRTTARSSP